jgi:hypothetical protein
VPGWSGEHGVVDPALATQARVGDDGRADGADDPADAVHAEHVERVVILEGVLDGGDEEEADRRDDEAEDDAPIGASEASRRGDRDEAGDGTRGGAQHRGLAVLDLLDDRPRDGGSGGGDEGVDEGEAGRRSLPGPNRR